MNILALGLFLDPKHYAQMENDVGKKAPEEACGIVAGEGSRSRLVIPVTNTLHSSNRFRMEPKEELDAFYLTEKNGLDVLAIYHSHPIGVGEPSETDLDELTFPGIIYLIWYREMEEWLCRGFLMNSPHEIAEVPVTIISL